MADSNRPSNRRTVTSPPALEGRWHEGKRACCRLLGKMGEGMKGTGRASSLRLPYLSVRRGWLCCTGSQSSIWSMFCFIVLGGGWAREEMKSSGCFLWPASLLLRSSQKWENLQQKVYGGGHATPDQDFYFQGVAEKISSKLFLAHGPAVTNGLPFI